MRCLLTTQEHVLERELEFAVVKLRDCRVMLQRNPDRNVWGHLQVHDGVVQALDTNRRRLVVAVHLLIFVRARVGFLFAI